MGWFRTLVIAAAGFALTACGASGPAPAAWTQFRHLPGVVDLAGPRGDGSFLVAAAGRLDIMEADGTLRPFARGAGGYRTATGTEPYLALAACPFGNDAAFALEPGPRPGLEEISAQGHARRFAGLPAGLALSGIAFDSTGRFGHRLLVTAEFAGRTTVFAIDCHGNLRTVVAGAPPMEGGIVVAPATFGRFGGDLIAPNETSGRIYAVDPAGDVRVLAVSGLPAGGDIGVESAGFVPPGATAAYLADRYSPGNRHPGDDAIVRLPGAQFAKAGIRPGDLLVATEGGARTVDIRCAATCAVRYVAAGPAIAHGEGHIVFAARLVKRA